MGDVCDAVDGYWTTPALISEVSTGKDWAVTATADNRSLFIFSEVGAFAQIDVYHSARPSVSLPWSAPVLVPELCWLGYENHDNAGHFSEDGLRMYFTRHRNVLPSNFYYSERASVTSPWSTPVEITS